MAEPKTKKNDASVEDFLNKSDESKREDAFTLLKMFKKATGEEAKMWGTSIVGFGEYHYKSERSAQEGDWMLVGFSPRKQNLTLYLMFGFNAMMGANHIGDLLAKLGKHKTSAGSCLYINKLKDVDLEVLEEIISRSYKAGKEKNNIK